MIQDLVAFVVYLNLPRCLNPGPVKAEVKAADPGEQGTVFHYCLFSILLHVRVTFCAKSGACLPV